MSCISNGSLVTVTNSAENVMVKGIVNGLEKGESIDLNSFDSSLYFTLEITDTLENKSGNNTESIPVGTYKTFQVEDVESVHKNV